MQYFKHHQIDKKKWDKCISSSKENIIYAFSWYLDCVSPFWEGFILEDKEKEYLAVMPVPVKKRYGISFLQQPLFAQQLGVFSIRKLAYSEFKTFLILLQDKFQLVSNYPFNITNYEEYKAIFEEVFCKPQTQIKINVLKNFVTHHLALQYSYTKIRQNYKKDTKYRINQAKKQGFETIKSNDIDLLYSFFENNVSLESGISKQAKPVLKTLFKVLQEKQVAELVYIKNQNEKGEEEIVSGVLFVKSNSFYQENSQDYSIIKWIYLFNAAKNSTSKRDESRRWFLDKFIKEKSNQVVKNNFENQSENSLYEIILDFESAQEKEVARFYASFGSEEKSFFVLDYNNLPFYIKTTQKLIHLIRQFIKKIMI